MYMYIIFGSFNKRHVILHTPPPLTPSLMPLLLLLRILPIQKNTLLPTFSK